MPDLTVVSMAPTADVIIETQTLTSDEESALTPLIWLAALFILGLFVVMKIELRTHESLADMGSEGGFDRRDRAFEHHGLTPITRDEITEYLDEGSDDWEEPQTSRETSIVPPEQSAEGLHDDSDYQEEPQTSPGTPPESTVNSSDITLIKSEAPYAHHCQKTDYRAHLLQATMELAQHLPHLGKLRRSVRVRKGLRSFLEQSDTPQDHLAMKTSWLIARFLCYAWIIRRVEDSVDKTILSRPWLYGTLPTSSSNLSSKESSIVRCAIGCLGAFQYYTDEEAFRLCDDQQQRIIDIVTLQVRGIDHQTLSIAEGYRCVTLEEFRRRWQAGSNVAKPDSISISSAASPTASPSATVTDRMFRSAFQSIEDGISSLSSSSDILGQPPGRLSTVHPFLEELVDLMLHTQQRIDAGETPSLQQSSQAADRYDCRVCAARRKL